MAPKIITDSTLFGKKGYVKKAIAACEKLLVSSAFLDTVSTIIPKLETRLLVPFLSSNTFVIFNYLLEKSDEEGGCYAAVYRQNEGHDLSIFLSPLLLRYIDTKLERFPESEDLFAAFLGWKLAHEIVHLINFKLNAVNMDTDPCKVTLPAKGDPALIDVHDLGDRFEIKAAGGILSLKSWLGASGPAAVRQVIAPDVLVLRHTPANNSVCSVVTNFNDFLTGLSARFVVGKDQWCSDWASQIPAAAAPVGSADTRAGDNSPEDAVTMTSSPLDDLNMPPAKVPRTTPRKSSGGVTPPDGEDDGNVAEDQSDQPSVVRDLSGAMLQALEQNRGRSRNFVRF